MADPKFLFICGCPRSGTTLLTRLLSCSADVALGMERFGHLSGPDSFALSPQLFERSRFLDVRPGDTFYDDLSFFDLHYDGIENKLQSPKYIGDKRPTLYLSYQQLFTAFPDAVVFFTLRDAIPVASSWNVRALSRENWPAARDYSVAVRDWNDSLERTTRALKNWPIHCVTFDQLEDAQSQHQVLFDQLGIEFGSEAARQRDRIMAASRRTRENRKVVLTDEQRRYVDEHANHELYAALRARRIDFGASGVT